MPIYEYRCNQCGCEFEELIRSAAQERELKCAKCGGADLERKMSVPASPQVSSGASTPSCGQSCQSGGGCPFQQ